MTLAEELMGKKPPIPKIQGRLVVRWDPPAQKPIGIAEFREWLKTAGDFTLQDVIDGLEMPERTARNLLHRTKGYGEIKRVGDKFRKTTKAEAAAIKHFG